MSENELCPRIGLWFKGCKFEPRYDTYSPTDALISQVNKQWALSEKDKELLSETQIYIQDICIRCGKVIERCDDQE